MSGSLSIIHPRSQEEIDLVRSLLASYGDLRGHDQALGDFEHELLHLPGEYGQPGGCLLLALWDLRAAGCVAYRPITEQICEMKRMFVLPDFQGKGIGQALGQQLLKEAQLSGYQRMRLDTHPHMTAATHLYLQLGFVEIPRYNQNPTPGIRFFEKMLCPDP